MDERKRTILASIIKDYVETAEPVGSRAVVKKHALKISAATVRNEMADLEEMGFLEQRHTSSGRIPSEQGFRYYVDCMMEKETLNSEEMDSLQNILQSNMQELNQAVEKIGHFLSSVTNYASFIILPPFSLSEFKHMEILLLEPGKAVILLLSDMGLIMHRNIEIANSVKSAELSEIARLFNQVLRNRRINEINRSSLQDLRDQLKRKRQVIDKTLEALETMLDNSQEEKVMISGALNMFNEPEFKDMEKLKRILTMMEEDSVLKKVVPVNIDEEVNIRIGSENIQEDMKDMSLVFAGYKSHGETGKIGLMGPIRMEYWKAVGAIEVIREIIEDIIKRY